MRTTTSRRIRIYTYTRISYIIRRHRATHILCSVSSACALEAAQHGAQILGMTQATKGFVSAGRTTRSSDYIQQHVFNQLDHTLVFSSSCRISLPSSQHKQKHSQCNALCNSELCTSPGYTIPFWARPHFRSSSQGKDAAFLSSTAHLMPSYPERWVSTTTSPVNIDWPSRVRRWSQYQRVAPDKSQEEEHCSMRLHGSSCITAAPCALPLWLGRWH
jgi:hypothetical protein